jgi:hypothetical protein
MVFPMGAKAPMSKKPKFDMGGDPNADDIGQPPHGEPDMDDEEIDGIMGQDMMNPGEEGSEDVLGAGNPLESALAEAGFPGVTPEQLTQIEAILKPVGAPKAPIGKPAPAIGGATAGGVLGSDIASL